MSLKRWYLWARLHIYRWRGARLERAYQRYLEEGRELQEELAQLGLCVYPEKKAQ